MSGVFKRKINCEGAKNILLSDGIIDLEDRFVQPLSLISILTLLLHFLLSLGPVYTGVGARLEARKSNCFLS